MHVWVAAATWGKAAERKGKPHTSEVWDTLMQDPFAVHAMAKITQYKIPEAAAFTLLGNAKKKEEENTQVSKSKYNFF
jgi:hypothetical protein